MLQSTRKIKPFSRKKQAGGNTDDEYARHPFGYDLLVARGWTIAPVNGDTKMAKVDLFQSPGNGTFLFYNLDASVGKGGANRRDDVLLVQYLIKISANVPGKFLAAVGGGPPQVAGVWGDFDDTMLGMVQSHWAERGTATFQDRRVDPVPQHQVMTPIHHTQYKILTLNVIYASLRPADYPKMAEATDCPPDLKPKIRAPNWLGT